MRRSYLSLAILAIMALSFTLPAFAGKEDPSSPKGCEIRNATAALEALPPTMLLEGDLCKTGKEPSVWLAKDGTPTPAAVLASGDTSILVDVTGFEFVQDARTWVVCGNGALASGCSMDLLINKDDADADPGNEIQEIQRVGVEVCLLDPDGGCANIEDADADPANEIQALSHPAGEICLSDDGCVDDEVDDADADPANEIQQLSKAGSTVSLSKGGGSFTDEVDDADADPANELQDWPLPGTPAGFADNVDDVDDADADPTNELQSLAYDEDTNILSISDGNGVDLSELEGGGGGPDRPCFSGDNRYADCGNGTVTDGVTGLIWLKNANCVGPKSWVAGNDWSAGLGDGQCGLSDGSGPGDWRLPTKEEWQAIMDRATANGCTLPGPYVPDTQGLGCWSEGDPFSGVQSYRYWSSTTDENYPNRAWRANLGNGNIYNAFKNSNFFVWPVRSGP